MRILTNLYLLNFLILILITPACSKKTTVEPETYSTISVLVTNEHGEPISGVIVTTSPKTSSAITDDDGKAIIQDIISRSYRIIINKSGCPEFSKYVKLENVAIADIHFIIFSKLNILIKDEFDRFINGATVRTKPATQTVTTDEEGMAVLENVPEQTYQFIIQRPNLPPIYRNVIIDENTRGEIKFVILSEHPVVKITKPLDDQVFSPFNIVFEGFGTDHEDGELPDNALVWSSNIDGELGFGKTLYIEKLSVGNHIIKLTGTDSDQKIHITKILLTIVDYNPDSYFPLLADSSWEYRHLISSFFVVNSNNVNELWKLDNLVITIDDEKKRISTIYYDIIIGTIIKHIKYTLIDYFETEDNNLYVIKTVEQIQEWKSNDDEQNPYFTIDITTEYSPDYLILKNLTNPTDESPIEFSVEAKTEWNYRYYNSISSVYYESYYLDTTIETGNTRYIQTDRGLYKAVEIIFTTSDSTKKWWLTKGIGLVQIDYTISDFEHTAVLAESDMLKFYRQYKPAINHGKSSSNLTAPSIRTFHISREAGEGLMELRNFLRSMCP